MKVLVTGAKGWAGKAVVEVLAHHHEVRTFDRPQVEWTRESIAWQGEQIEGDIADYETVRQATRGVDAVVHMAVASHRSNGLYGNPDAPTPAVPFAVNVMGTYNVLDTARRNGARRIIMLGSASLRHLRRTPPLKADGRVEWMDDSGLYDLTKYLQERLGWFYAAIFGMSVMVLRCGFIVDGASGTTKYAKSLRETDPWDQATGAWVDRYDVAEACLRALTVDHAGFEILYLIGWHRGEDYFDIERTRQKLGLQFRHRFEGYD